MSARNPSKKVLQSRDLRGDDVRPLPNVPIFGREASYNRVSNGLKGLIIRIYCQPCLRHVGRMKITIKDMFPALFGCLFLRALWIRATVMYLVLVAIFFGFASRPALISMYSSSRVDDFVQRSFLV